MVKTHLEAGDLRAASTQLRALERAVGETAEVLRLKGVIERRWRSGADRP